MEKLELYIPTLDELCFYQKMMSDPETMSYNANWDVEYEGYHKDTGCIDFPESEWAEWYAYWVGNEPERFFAYIKRTSDGSWVGNINFHYISERDWWDMGIVIYAPYRGKGYGVPALRLMLEHAFKDCGVTRLHNEFEPARSAALKIHLAAGFRDIGIEDGMQQLVLTKEEYLRNNYIWTNSNYKTRKGKWCIAILLEAGYQMVSSVEKVSQYLKLADRIYFHAMLLPYPQSEPLTDKELTCFCNGLQMVSKYILASVPEDSSLIIALHKICFSDCDIQDEGFTACAIQWASETFRFPMPNIITYFDEARWKHIYDFSSV